ncbi:MAG: hypothetical protein LBM38_02345 [Clostridiales bacterium]|jgi:hypothetical protein|nr:hypothetical protein [Clostridiales bacterium]
MSIIDDLKDCSDLDIQALVEAFKSNALDYTFDDLKEIQTELINRRMSTAYMGDVSMLMRNMIESGTVTKKPKATNNVAIEANGFARAANNVFASDAAKLEAEGQAKFRLKSKFANLLSDDGGSNDDEALLGGGVKPKPINPIPIGEGQNTVAPTPISGGVAAKNDAKNDAEANEKLPLADDLERLEEVEKALEDIGIRTKNAMLGKDDKNNDKYSPFVDGTFGAIGATENDLFGEINLGIGDIGNTKDDKKETGVVGFENSIKNINLADIEKDDAIRLGNKNIGGTNDRSERPSVNSALKDDVSPALAQPDIDLTQRIPTISDIPDIPIGASMPFANPIGGEKTTKSSVGSGSAFENYAQGGKKMDNINEKLRIATEIDKNVSPSGAFAARPIAPPPAPLRREALNGANRAESYNVEDKYPTFAFLASFFKVLSWVLVILTLAGYAYVSVFLLPPTLYNLFVAGGVALLVSFAFIVFCLAMSEKYKWLMSVDSNLNEIIRK